MNQTETSIGVKKTNPYLIKNITQDMYVPGSEHINRLSSFGKRLCERTIREKRYYITKIVDEFGNKDLSKLKVRDIEDYLLKDTNHSGSWKNNYLETFSSVYEETIWKCPKQINKPQFRRFIRNSKKSDILNTDELNRFFNPEIWDNKRDYLIFKVIASCGLRLGEARALRFNQFITKQNFLVINGFCKRDGLRTNYNKCGNQDNTKIRIAPIQKDLVDDIILYYQSTEKKEYEILFTDDISNRPLSQDYLERIFRKQLRKAYINTKNRKLVPHSLRFTYVTRMRRNADAETVKKIVGHTSVDMTDYYTLYGFDEMIAGIQTAVPAAEELFD